MRARKTVERKMPRDFHQLDWDAAIEDDLRQLVRLAVREDLGRQNDWTTVALVGPDTQGRAAIVARAVGRRGRAASAADHRRRNASRDRRRA